MFWVWADLMKVIPETRRAHRIWYVRFYYYHWVDTSDGGLVFITITWVDTSDGGLVFITITESIPLMVD